MTTLFKETDNIVRLGKWVYPKIPSGDRCRRCPVLGRDKHSLKRDWYCDLRPTYGLMHDEEGPFKDKTCPKRKK